MVYFALYLVVVILAACFLLIFICYFFNILEDKGDSPGGLDSDSSSSSPAPPSSHRTGSSVSLSGSHYQTSTGLIKGNILVKYSGV